ncbi:MAG: L,D-transpeptidase family protein [Gammaproteobacteria bacterium]|jgi:L,D-transpeptidase ErfK/SrfK|nr:L,D-transpeptidase family protein [Gammaproteobacteria bacterium]
MKAHIWMFAGLLGWMPVAGAGLVYELGPDVESDALIGAPEVVVARYEDTLVDIGRRVKVGFEELRLANPEVDPWLPGAGTEVVVPTAYLLPRAPRRGIVINIAEYRLYVYYQEGGRTRVATLPASIGRMDWETPLGQTRVVAMARNPSWYPPDSVREEHAAEGRPLPRVVPPGPNNPLGAYAIRLGLPGYLIHGTNRPAGVGMRVTHGCVRLYPEDIEWLFARTVVDTPVRIVNQPVKFGWQGEELYMEVHPVLDTAPAAAGADVGDAAAPAPVDNSLTLVTEEYVRATAEREANVDWDRVEEVFREKSGLPVLVGVRRTPAEVMAER